MPSDFDRTLDSLPASPPEAHLLQDHPTMVPAPSMPLYDWATSCYDVTDPGLSSIAAGPMASPPFPPASPPPHVRRPRNATLIAVFVVAALVASAFVGAGAREWLSSPSVTAAPTPATDGTLSDRAAPAERPSTDSERSSGSSGSSQAPSDWSAVTDAVIPGVVDIESRVSGGVAAGTGMVLSESGEILTNNHVVEGASQIVVTVVSTGEQYAASIVGTDPGADVAVLQLSDAEGLATIPLGDSDDVAVNDPVVAIGNAGGDGGEPAVTTGNVVALHQQIVAGDQHSNDTETLTDMIQIDAEVVSGESGGPLADADGEVVGMNTAASSANGRYPTTVNQAFAIPINRALSIAEQLVASGSDSSSSGSSSASGRGYLGVKVQTAAGGGAEVVAVITGSAAEAAGLEAGDVITALDGSSLASADALTTALQSSQSGDRAELTWQNADGRTLRATVVLGAA